MNAGSLFRPPNQRTTLTHEARNLIQNLYRSKWAICDIVKKVEEECEMDVDLLDIDQAFVEQDVAWVITQAGADLKKDNGKIYNGCILDWLKTAQRYKYL
jgi:hypothetical protein